MSGVRSTFSDRSSDQVQVMLQRNNRLHGHLLPGAQRAAAELGADDTKPDMPDVQMTGAFSPHNTSGVLPLELNHMSNQPFTFAYTFLVRGNTATQAPGHSRRPPSSAGAGAVASSHLFGAMHAVH